MRAPGESISGRQKVVQMRAVGAPSSLAARDKTVGGHRLAEEGEGEKRLEHVMSRNIVYKIDLFKCVWSGAVGGMGGGGNPCGYGSRQHCNYFFLRVYTLLRMSVIMSDVYKMCHTTSCCTTNEV